MFATSDLDLDSICTGLQGFLEVSTADGATFWLRFWDPAFWHGLASLSGSHWSEAWDLRPLSLLSACVVIEHRRAHGILEAGDPGLRHAAAIRPPSRDDVAVMRSVIIRPGLASPLRRTPRNHWALRHLVALARNVQIPDATLARLLSLEPGTRTQQVCAAALAHAGMTGTASARTLRYILEADREHGLQA